MGRCQEVCREGQGPEPEHRLERTRAMELDQVARTFHFRHQDLQVRRYRRKRHQEAVQIRRQVVRQEVIYLYDRNDPSVRQHVIRRVSVRHRKTPSSFDRSIDISMMGGNRRDYCFFFEYMYFHQKKKVERKRHILTSFVVFFSLKRGDFERGRAVVNSSSPFFFYLFRQKNSIARDEKTNKKAEKHPLFF